MAARLKNKEVLALLVSQCTKAQINEALISATIHGSTKKHEPLCNVWTALCEGVADMSGTCTNILLEHGASTEATRQYGRTPSYVPRLRTWKK